MRNSNIRMSNMDKELLKVTPIQLEEEENDTIINSANNL